MIMKTRRLQTVLLLLFIMVRAYASAFDYRPTPLSKSIADHDVIVLGVVESKQGERAKVRTVQVIKGDAQISTFDLPAVWRPNTQETYGPIALVPSGKYMLMLKKREGVFDFSSDFASKAVHQILGEKDPLIRVAQTLWDVQESPTRIQKERVLAAAYATLDAPARSMLVEEFIATRQPDVATVPFLIRCVEEGPDMNETASFAARAISRYHYTEAVPRLLHCLQKRKGPVLDLARALAEMKARDAYDPIMKLIRDESVGSRPYFIEALATLDDERAIPYLLETLHRNLKDLDPKKDTYRSWSVQENEFAAWGLGRLKTPQAVPALIQILARPEYDKLRNNAVVALGQIGPAAKTAVPVLRRLMENVEAENGSFHYFAMEAMKAIQEAETKTQDQKTDNPM